MKELSDLVLSHGDKTDGTSYPFWFIAQKGGALTGPVMISNGFWFNRADAEDHLKNKAHRYPKTAFVWCASGHMSWHVRKLYEIAKREVGE